jgi:hypothetical protein
VPGTLLLENCVWINERILHKFVRTNSEKHWEPVQTNWYGVLRLPSKLCDYGLWWCYDCDLKVEGYGSLLVKVLNGEWWLYGGVGKVWRWCLWWLWMSDFMLGEDDGVWRVVWWLDVKKVSDGYGVFVMVCDVDSSL